MRSWRKTLTGLLAFLLILLLGFLAWTNISYYRQSVENIRQQNIHITDTYGPYLGKEYLDTEKLMELSRLIQAGTASNITEAIEMDKNREGKTEKN